MGQPERKIQSRNARWKSARAQGRQGGPSSGPIGQLESCPTTKARGPRRARKSQKFADGQPGGSVSCPARSAMPAGLPSGIQRAARGSKRSCSPAIRSNAVPQQTTRSARTVAPARQNGSRKSRRDAGIPRDPLIVVARWTGGFGHPSAGNRLAARKVLGLRQITALISPDRRLRIRISRTQHREGSTTCRRSLRSFVWHSVSPEAPSQAKESQFTAEFEAPENDHAGIVTRSRPLRWRTTDGGPEKSRSLQ